MDEGMAAATAAASGIGNTYVYYCTVKPLKTLLTEINNPNITFPYTLQLTSDVSNHIELDENHLFAAIEINKDTIIRTDVYDIENFKKVYALHTLNPRSNVSAEPVSAAHASAEASTGSAMVTLGNPAASIGPVASAAADAIGAAAIAAPAADEDLAAAEEKSVEASATHSNEELKSITGEYTNYEFKIGMHGNQYSGGWRMATAAEWKDRTFQDALISAYMQQEGWLLLEDSLNYNGSLCVTEGYVQINDANIIEVADNINTNTILLGMYVAMNQKTVQTWQETPPTLKDEWNVIAFPLNKTLNPPCLFVRQKLNSAAAAPAAGTSLDVGAAAAAAPIIQSAFLSNEQQRIAAIPEEVEFAIGYHSRDYKGWKMMKANLLDTNKENILRDYWKDGGGFYLLTQPFTDDSRLYTDIGFIHIDTDTQFITRNKNVKNKYIAQIRNKDWTEQYPTTSNIWNVMSVTTSNFLIEKPCLFMRIPNK